MQDLVEYFLKVGIKIDQKKLNDFESSLKRVEASLQRFMGTFDGTVGKIERGLARTQNAQKRQLDIEGKQIRNANLKSKLDQQNLKTQLQNSKVQSGMLRLAEAERRINAKNVADANKLGINKGLASTVLRFGTQKMQAMNQQVNGWLYGPSRSTYDSVSKASAWQHGPSRSDMYKLADAYHVEQMRATERAQRQAQREADSIARRSRKRVMDPAIAEEMAYKMQERKNSWNLQHTMSTGMGLMRGFLPGFGAAWSLSSLNTMAQELKAVETSMLAVAGSTEAANQQMAYLDNLASTAGLTIRDIGPQYVKYFSSVKGSSIEPIAQQGFTSFVKYGRMMGMGKEDMKGALISLQQMIGKGFVMSEELNF